MTEIHLEKIFLKKAEIFQKTISELSDIKEMHELNSFPRIIGAVDISFIPEIAKIQKL